MVQITEAIFSDGVLKPLRELSLKEPQLVRLIVEPADDPLPDRAEALKKLRAGIAGMQFFSEWKARQETSFMTAFDAHCRT
jgi:predicted DNA-binding antitoxin AbrB/MazE fold protein